MTSGYILAKVPKCFPARYALYHIWNFPYAYPGKHHEPCEYPDTPVFKAMFNEIARTDKNFNKTNYTCLATLMENGDDYLGFHSDNEKSIVPDSMIYCASFGVTRDIVYASKKDPQTKHSYSLPSGSVYCMSAQSQRTWRHSIPADPRIKRPRVSFTFRMLKSPIDTESEVVGNAISPPFQAKSDSTVSKALIPPIHRPCVTRKSANSTHVLFLTDSILKSFPEKSFGPNIICKKLVMYKLTDIYNYIHMFGHYDYVVISSGINDLSRYNYTAGHLSYFMKTFVRDICNSFPDTVFVFRSLLPTNIHWVNAAVTRFNYNMFLESIDLYNFNYFDTYFVNQNPNLLDRSDRNGIHISRPIIHHLSSQIITHITHCINHYSDTREVWPIRPAFREVLRERRTVSHW